MTTRSGRRFKGNTNMAEDGRENAGVSELVKLLLEDRRIREEATARREAELMEGLCSNGLKMVKKSHGLPMGLI